MNEQIIEQIEVDTIRFLKNAWLTARFEEIKEFRSSNQQDASNNPEKGEVIMLKANIEPIQTYHQAYACVQKKLDEKRSEYKKLFGQEPTNTDLFLCITHELRSNFGPVNDKTLPYLLDALSAQLNPEEGESHAIH